MAVACRHRWRVPSPDSGLDPESPAEAVCKLCGAVQEVQLAWGPELRSSTTSWGMVREKKSS